MILKGADKKCVSAQRQSPPVADGGEGTAALGDAARSATWLRYAVNTQAQIKNLRPRAADKLVDGAAEKAMMLFC